ncbi:hypothetical protein HHK36_021165 [Tetracentron sinense]|uniref:Protein kinase domain-containing protein n=1 Tax=Tetracentron sinense TaxID=13715 RepID=A0A834YTF1_TETSI|nr:hypothetical protein HHK36_021165 [Tetracentron sinense]
MGVATKIGVYQLGRTIGEGSFAKVKLAVNTINGLYVAIKIIDKQMVIKNKLMYQIQREISTMKLLHHPNIVRIFEVIATKTKIYIVMEYISGGQLSDKMYYLKKLSEEEARKYFQQLIDAVDYCHVRCVYHRDLKPENLLLDGKGNLKVSDFGLSTLRKARRSPETFYRLPAALRAMSLLRSEEISPLSISCIFSVIANKGYDGAAADVWSCGVILFELLAGFIPFDDRNLMNLYRKISRADYRCPEWFKERQRKLISRILDPIPRTRMTVTEILQDEWFQTNYEPSARIECEENISMDDVNAAFDGINVSLNRQDEDKQKTRLGSRHPINETIEKIEVAAKDASLSVERMKNSKVKIHQKQKLTRCSKSYFNLSAEVIKVTPTHCVVEISKSAGELLVYKEFCKSLSSLLTEKSDVSAESDVPTEVSISGKDIKETGW